MPGCSGTSARAADPRGGRLHAPVRRDRSARLGGSVSGVRRHRGPEFLASPRGGRLLEDALLLEEGFPELCAFE
jgi:hypothetical protein